MVDTDYSKLTDIQAKRQLILGLFYSTLIDFFYYDRKNDEAMHYTEMENAIENKVVEVEDFKEVIDKFFKYELRGIVK